MVNDPMRLIDETPMSVRQWAIVFVCVLLTALDGYDALSISFAAPGLSLDWGLSKAALGVVLSMELVGMALGSITLGLLADRLGRRPILQCSVLTAAVGMIGATIVNTVPQLAAFRFLTGLGIGGILATTVTIVSECTNMRVRSLCVSLTAGAYPAGAFVGGSIAATLADDGWREIFKLGAIATCLCVPMVLLLIPETPAFLGRNRLPNSLDRLNAVLLKFRKPTCSSLGGTDTARVQSGFAELFKRDLRLTTLLLTAAFFFHLCSNYFLIKWAAKLVADFGYTATQAGGVLVWVSAGGVAGSTILGILSRFWAVRDLIRISLVISTLGVALFGLVPRELTALSFVGAAAGFGLSASVVGFYAIFVSAFPTNLRATGIGFVIGFGRAGSSISPIVAGYMLNAGASIPLVTVAMSAGSGIAIVCLALLQRKRSNPSMSV